MFRVSEFFEIMPSDSPRWRNMVITKSARACICCPFPRFEAFALPISVGTSNAEAHTPYEYTATRTTTLTRAIREHEDIHIHRASIVASSLTEIKKLRSSESSRIKRRINAFLICKLPRQTLPPQLSSPSSHSPDGLLRYGILRKCTIIFYLFQIPQTFSIFARTL